MATTIQVSTTANTAYNVVPDTSGSLVIQTGATPTTALTLDTSQNATFAGKVTASNLQGPAFSAYISSGQSVSSGTWTKIQYQTKVFDTASAFDNTTNYRFQPTIAGYYQVTGAVCFAGITSASTWGTIQIYKTGQQYQYGPNLSGTGNGLQLLVSGLLYLNGSTDYVEIYAFQTQGSSQTTQNQSNSGFFQAALVRSA
jgi:hypothetical protein